MSIVLQINIKGASKKITQLQYEYKWQAGEQITIQDFLDATVDITLNRYKESLTDEVQLNTVLKVLSSREIEEKAESGKVDFGVHYNSQSISSEKAKENATQCFIDGLIALFIDDERYENINDTITLREGSQVTFVRMVFLAGRMW